MLRMRMAYLVRRAEYRRRNGQVGKFVRAVTGNKKGGGGMVSFKGRAGWVYDSSGVKREVAAYYREWMGAGRARWYHKGGAESAMIAKRPHSAQCVGRKRHSGTHLGVVGTRLAVRRDALGQSALTSSFRRCQKHTA